MVLSHPALSSKCGDSLKNSTLATVEEWPIAGSVSLVPMVPNSRSDAHVSISYTRTVVSPLPDANIVAVVLYAHV